MTEPTVHLIAACAARKAVLPTRELYLRSVPQKRMETRAAEWMRRLHAAKASHHALDLYQGEYWQVVRTLAGASNTRLWIASAGYGLIPSHQRIASYSATFAAGDADSVLPAAAGSGASRTWWALVRGFATAEPEIDRSDFVVVIASAAYVYATSDDLLQMRRRLPTRAQFIVFSSFTGRDDSEWLNEHTVRLPASARLTLGGTAGAVGARAASAYFRDGLVGRSADEVERVLSNRYARAVIDQPQRAAMTDASIRTWLRKALLRESLSCSAALRVYRDSGYACEQSRFGRIYRAVLAEADR